MACNPDRGGMLAAGSYAGAAALLDSRTKELLCLLEGGHAGGITHVRAGQESGAYPHTGTGGRVRVWRVAPQAAAHSAPHSAASGKCVL